MKCGDVIQILEELAPVRYACSWDNVGLLLGRRDKDVRRIYVALDVTDQVLDEVIAGGYDMLVTHHPILFRPVNRINDDDFLGRWMLRLLAQDISCYALHTNFDIAPGCMADLAAERLGLKAERPLEITVVEDGVAQGVGRVGTLERTRTVRELCGLVKEKFEIPFVTLFARDENQPAQRIAISPGSGKGMAKEALAAGCDVLISGDFGHHDGLDAVAAGLTVINAGHFGLEHIFPAFLAEYLRKRVGAGVEVAAVDVQGPERVM